MWLHPAENSRFGARHHQVDPQIRCVHHYRTTQWHGWARHGARRQSLSRWRQDVRERLTSIDMLLMKQGMHVQNLMNRLWDIRIFLGLVPKESNCSSSKQSGMALWRLYSATSCSDGLAIKFPSKVFKFPSVSQGKCSDSRTGTVSLALLSIPLPVHYWQSPPSTLYCVAEKVWSKIPEINLSIDQKKKNKQTIFRIRNEEDKVN